ncbi:MAG: TrmB family transcriptional regulator [Candidatus Ranarchaeia archaeon]
MTDKYIDSLKLIGLTEYESKTFIGLLNIGAIKSQSSAKAGVIAKYSKVPQPKIYDILSNLEKKGLVQSTDDRPKRFYVLPPSTSLTRIMDNISDQVNETKIEFDELFAKSYLLKDDNPDTQIFTNDQTIKNIIKRSIINANNEIKINAEDSEKIIPKIIKNKLKKTNLDVKLLLNSEDLQKDLQKNKKIQIKKSELLLNFIIVDNKTLLIRFEKGNNTSQIISTWNRSLVDFFNRHFDTQWESADDI